MCQSCYDKWGRPTEWNDEISRAVDLVETIYQWHPAGGLLHIVLDDWNIGDEKVAWVESYVAQEAGGWEEEEPEMVAATRELAAATQGDERGGASIDPGVHRRLRAAPRTLLRGRRRGSRCFGSR